MKNISRRTFVKCLVASSAMLYGINLNASTDTTKKRQKTEELSGTVFHFENAFLDTLKPGSFAALSSIHEYLFGTIYPFAGKIRDANISKGDFRFAPVSYLKVSIENIQKMPQNTYDTIIEKYVEMNVAHPFREGNGRSM